MSRFKRNPAISKAERRAANRAKAAAAKERNRVSGNARVAALEASSARYARERQAHLEWWAKKHPEAAARRERDFNRDRCPGCGVKHQEGCTRTGHH